MKRNLRRINHRVLAAAAVTVALLVPLGVFGGPALARGTSASSAQYQYKIAVCHRTHSRKHPWVLIHVSSASWPAHQRHGDLLVPPATCPPTNPPAAPKPGKGKGGDNGKGDDNGKGNAKGHGK